jgi:hypothetical protein
MWMMGLALTIEWVQGTTNATGWGFKGLFGETLVLGFFNIGSLMNTTLRIWLMSLADNRTLTGIRQRTSGILFLCSNGCVSSSSSESDYAESSHFYGFGLELGPAPTSFFSSSADLQEEYSASPTCVGCV